MKQLREITSRLTQLVIGGMSGTSANGIVAKETDAFATLANECVHGVCNNTSKVTRPNHPPVLGKISL